MKIMYQGPFDEVRLPLPGGRTLVVEPLKPVDVPKDVARSLLEQGANWRKPPMSVQTSDGDPVPSEEA